MKRHLSGLVVIAAVVACGLAASACDSTPPAATANGTSISIATINSQLQTLESTQTGGCLLQLENPQLSTSAAQGDGGSGTFSMPFAGAELESQVGQLLAEQYAMSKGLSVSPSDLTAAKTNFISTLDGEITQAVNQSTEEGTVSLCTGPTGAGISGAQLLAGLPTSVAEAQIRNQAFDEKLLADGADLSGQAVLAYYRANKANFSADCVSRIVTTTKAKADDVVTLLNAGASFAALAKSASIDTQSAANGGALGCTNTHAEVEQALNQQNIPIGRPLTPMQDPSSGQWYIYEVTSQTVEPLEAATPVIRRELLQTTANVDRVSRQIIAFAHGSDVSVDPRYGTWTKANLVPPVAPPAKYLLPAVSGTPISDLGSSAGTGSPVTGSPTTGAPATGAPATGAPATGASGSSGSTTGG